jgi:hypothetical protein
MLVAPVEDGRVGMPALFNIEEEALAPRRLTLAGSAGPND